MGSLGCFFILIVIGGIFLLFGLLLGIIELIMRIFGYEGNDNG
jgi:hypothetical protein